MQPGCTGVYEDGWCNVCGSPEPTAAPVEATPAASSAPATAAAPAPDSPGADGIPSGLSGQVDPQVATPGPGRS
ncbi:MAG: hypothetical protein LOY01_13285, partial [Brachybacterium paraconglomeratum]|nr:hypothetical protein [Brachybacterium paraconglomeratum]